MPIVLFVEKNGTIKEMKLKEVVPEELYRKASFKTAEGFGVQATWSKPDRYRVSLYARKNGRPGSENKYDFPPPVDNDLFFGGCVLTNQDVDGNYIDLTKSAWDRIYEELFGGFEDLGSEDSDSDEESEDKDVPKTKEGYAKDGFIVDDAEEVESETSEESDSDSSDVELEGEEGDDDIDTDDLCEDDDDGEEDVSDSEVEAEDEDEDEDDDGDDFYDSDGDGPKQKKKKPVKKAAPTKSATKKGGKGVAVVAPTGAAKKRAPASGGGVGTRSKAAKKVAPEPAENGGGYLNCSDELEEEAYLDDA